MSVDALKEQEEKKAQVVRMAKLAKVIKEKSAESASSGGPKHVCLFRTLLHPTSFSQTVEKFFDLAFLIKAGDAGLDKEEDGLYIKRMKKPDADDFKTGKAVRTRAAQARLSDIQEAWRAGYLPGRRLSSSRDGDEAVEDEEDAAAAARPKRRGVRPKEAQRTFGESVCVCCAVVCVVHSKSYRYTVPFCVLPD